MAKVIFCIAGMHRSGSSLFANWLHSSGIFIGKHLYGPASSNKKGHFEDYDFLNLHKNDLLEKKEDISGLFVKSNTLKFENKSKLLAKEIIKQRANYTIWGWKEPRTTLYLNAWKELIPQLKVIVLVREEDEVIKSLYKRLKKNKWYYTRNPIKKLRWWFDIDLHPEKWYRIFNNTYHLYYNACKSFQALYPDDVLYITLDEFIQNSKATGKKLNQFFNTELSFVELDSIFDTSLLSKK